MERLLIIGGLFVAAGLCEIGGGYLVWGWMRGHKPLLWALLGALILAAYGVVAALQPISEFGRVYAAYGGVFIALALLWGMVVDGFRPDRYDLLGALICVIGMVVMVAPSRG
jgi:small multidrug resistance family-3 protein